MNRNRPGIFLCLAALATVTLLTGCQVFSVSGTPKLTENGIQGPPPPRTIAILPTTDASENPDLADLLRHSLYQASSELPYADVELRDVDARLAQIASRLDMRPDQLDDAAQAQPSVADLVLFSKIVSVGRLYLVLYAHIKLEVDVALVDTRSRRVLYRNNFVFRDRISAPTVSIFGLAESMFETVWHLRQSGIDRTLEQAAQRIIGDLPPQTTDMASDSKLRLVDFQVHVPAATLKPGDVISFTGKGTPKSKATFSIGKIATRLPMREGALGTYEGSYQVKEGDDTHYGIVEVNLDSADGKDHLTYAATESSFAIDTLPPQQGEVSRWWPDSSHGKGTYLELAVTPAKMFRKNLEEPVRFHIYRRTVKTGEPAAGFTLVGTTIQKLFLDETTERGVTYDYYVVTEDAVGNKSQPGKTAQIAVR